MTPSSSGMPPDSSSMSGTDAGRKTPPPLRLDLSIVPERFRPYEPRKRPSLFREPVKYWAHQFAPTAEQWERGRQLALMGDPLADDFAGTYAGLGYQQARAMLDTALDKGIEHVEDAPAELRALFAELDGTPAWLDLEKLEVGAAVMRRYSPLHWLYMRLAFAQTYVNAYRGMPLYLTGSLGPETVARRLKETNKWRLEVQQPGGMKRFGEGFKTTVRVRVLHALVRHHLIRHPEWDVQVFGMPINQLDMAGANIGMMLVHSNTLRMLGARITPDELRAVIHFWRYHGRIIGVEEELNPTSFRHMMKAGQVIDQTTPFLYDERAKELTQSTMSAYVQKGKTPFERLLNELDIRVSNGLFYWANGKELYQKMELPTDKRWRYFAPAVFPLFFSLETMRKMTPGGTRLAAELGRRHIELLLDDEIVRNAPFKPYHLMKASQKAVRRAVSGRRRPRSRKRPESQNAGTV